MIVITYFSTFVVGAVFLVTGIVKALSAKQFIIHNFKYGLLHPQIVLPMTIGFIGLECALGVALLLHEFPQYFVPGSIILLLCLSALTMWATSTGRTEDCGCYGGLLVMTPKQSILLNMAYILLLWIAWLYPVANHHTETWQWVLSLIVLVSSIILSWHTRNNPILDFWSLKPGSSWKRSWLTDSPQDLQQGSHFVMFLSPGCSACKKRVPFLNVMHAQKDLPQVMGIVPLVDTQLEAFKANQKINFPLASMNSLLFSRLVDAFPTNVLLEEGVISGKWEGDIPQEFLDRIKQCYEQIFYRHKLERKPIINYGDLPFNPVVKQIDFGNFYLYIDNFLSQEEWINLLDYTLKQESAFISISTAKNQLDARHSLVLYSLDIFSEMIVNKIQFILPQVLAALDLPAFYASQIEAQITAHNNGNYYKVHNDNGSFDTLNREVSYVYYFNREPKAFSGGELVIYGEPLDQEVYDNKNSLKVVEPRNNSIVFFLSRYFHEVLPVSCPSQAFADSRFTLNGWIRKSFFN